MYDEFCKRLPVASERAKAGQLVLWLCFLLLIILQFSVARGWTQIFPHQMHAITLIAVNIPLVACGLLLLESIVGRFWAAAFIALCAAAVIAAANRIKMNLLGSAVEPADDIHRIRDVFPFLGGVLFHWQTLAFLIMLCALGFVTAFLARRFPIARWNRRKRLFVGLSTLLILATVPAVEPYLRYLHLYQQASTNWVFCCRHDGVFLSYLANLREFTRRSDEVSPPEGYGPGRIQSISDRILKGYQPAASASERPDIVLVASEAMMDPTGLSNISHPVDWLSSVHRLQKQAGPYHLVSPALGGMSIDADFEVLTGFSTRFIGSEDVCVSDHLDRAIPSIARVLKSQGYDTTAIVESPPTLFRHSYVFPKAFGFDRAFFQDDMGVRMGDTPDSAIEKVILREINTPSSRPRFIYAQFEKNHSPWNRKKKYNHAWVVPSSQLAGAEASSFNVYIQGVYATDQVIGDLADSLEKRGKPAVLAVYGDHLPAIGTSALRTIGVFSESNEGSPQSQLALHTTPGLIWTTGGPAAIPHDELVGMNYFSGYLLKTAGISHPFYTGFLPEAEITLPAFNHQVVCTSGGQPVASFPEASQATADDYELLQYDMIYGNRYAATSLFPELESR